jgi:hypothetical protein
MLEIILQNVSKDPIEFAILKIERKERRGFGCAFFVFARAATRGQFPRFARDFGSGLRCPLNASTSSLRSSE